MATKTEEPQGKEAKGAAANVNQEFSPRDARAGTYTPRYGDEALKVGDEVRQGVANRTASQGAAPGSRERLFLNRLKELANQFNELNMEAKHVHGDPETMKVENSGQGEVRDVLFGFKGFEEGLNEWVEKLEALYGYPETALEVIRPLGKSSVPAG